MPVKICKKSAVVTPDLSAACEFLTSAFPEAERHTFLTFDDGEMDHIENGKKSKKKHKDPSLTKEMHGSLDKCWDALMSLNGKGAGVFYTVNETDLKGRKKENIKRVRAVWQEDDDGWKGKLPLEPHIEIETSPGRYHRLWLVDGLSFDEFDLVMETMVAAFGSDKNAKDLTRVLRLPGTVHRKGKPFLVRVTKISEVPPYTREQILETFSPLPKAPASFEYPSIQGKDGELVLVSSALEYVKDESWVMWVTVGKILKDTFGGAGLDVWIKWSEKSEKFIPGECGKEWDAFKLGNHNPATIGTIFWLAQKNGWSFPETTNEQQSGDTPLEVLINLFTNGGGVRFNWFNQNIELEDAPWSNNKVLNEVCLIRAYLWAHKKLHKSLSKGMIYDAIVLVADENGYDPLMGYLNGLEWDGVLRLHSWLTLAFGAADNAYVRAVGFMYLISAVARGLKPGCKVDTVLVLEGDQGAQKSMTLRLLAGDERFSDNLSPMESKDAVLDLQGKWLIEISDLSAIKRSGIETIKAFVSRQVDRCRPPYGRVSEDYPRRCVFVGTTNEAEYLKDSTGNRRFWPVACTKSDPDWVGQNRDQLWAEAVQAYKAGEKWWPIDPKLIKLIEEEQAKREQTDPWLVRITDICEKRKVVSIEQILSRMEVKPGNQTKVHQDRVAGCLKKLGWKRKRVSLPGQKNRPWLYVAPGVIKITKAMKENFMEANGQFLGDWSFHGGVMMTSKMEEI